MYCNIVWPLLGFVLSYLLTGSVSSAAIAAIIVLSLISGIDIFIKVIRTLRRCKSIRINKPLLNGAIATALIIAVPSILIVSQLPYIANRYSNYQLAKASKQVPKDKLIAAVKTLKMHQGSMQYCSLIFYPSLRGASQSVIAKYLAYYAFEDKYCRHSWQFGKNNCAYLEGISRSTGRYTPIKNLMLCRYAHSDLYKKLVREV